MTLKDLYNAYIQGMRGNWVASGDLINQHNLAETPVQDQELEAGLLDDLNHLCDEALGRCLVERGCPAELAPDLVQSYVNERLNKTE